MLVLEELQRVDAAFSHLLAQKFSVSYPFFLNLKVVDYFYDKLYSVLKQFNAFPSYNFKPRQSVCPSLLY